MKNISRRDFLKGGAAMGVLAAMGGATMAAAEESYTYADTIKWDAQYDVVVLGMGLAGMNAAIAAADAALALLNKTRYAGILENVVRHGMPFVTEQVFCGLYKTKEKIE